MDTYMFGDDLDEDAHGYFINRNFKNDSRYDYEDKGTIVIAIIKFVTLKYVF